MVLLSMDSYKLKVHLEKWHVVKRCFLKLEVVMEDVWILTLFLELNSSYNIVHSYPITAYLSFIWTAQFPSLYLQSVSPSVKNARCLRMEVLFVEMSLSCGWCVNDALPPIPGFLQSLTVTVLAGNWSLRVTPGNMYAMPPGILLKLFWIFSFTSPALSPCAPWSLFSSKSHLCRLLWAVPVVAVSAVWA